MIILLSIILIAAFIYDAEWLLDRWFHKKVIVNCERHPYLHRWYIFKTEHITLFVHKFVRSDEDRALHDHPWAFLVIPIWRGYIEHSDREFRKLDAFRRLCVVAERTEYRVTGEFPRQRSHRIPPSIDPRERIPIFARVLPLIGTSYRNFHYRHRVELLKDEAGADKAAWSIFFHFERVKDWGYWTPTGFILHSKWWADLCE